MQNKAIYKLTSIATCVAIITLCAWISIPFTVAFTMQSFAVFLISALFPISVSVSSIAAYLCIGALGAPVFAGFNFGASAFAGASGGFLLGFLFSSFFISSFRKKYHKSKTILAICLTIALILCYLCGYLWYILVFQPSVSASNAFAICILPYVIPDIIKIFLVMIVHGKLYPFIKKLPI